MKQERTVPQILTAVRAALATREAPEIIRKGMSHEASAIRIAKDRFVLVRDIVDTSGCLPGDTNIFISAAFSAAETLGIITGEESKRFFEWQRAEEKAVERDRELDDVARRANRMGYRLAKKRKPKPVKKRRRRS